MNDELGRPRDRWAAHTDPDMWTTIRCTGSTLIGQLPTVGDTFGFRYGAWKVLEIRPFCDADLTDEQRRKLMLRAAQHRHLHRPYAAVLELVAGPNLIQPGRNPVHVDGHKMTWKLLGDRFQVCSCHGHPWPCQQVDLDRVADSQTRALREAIRKSDPDLCGHCGEPITGRQKSIEYPGENVDMPGAAPARFHLRGGCRDGTADYERRWLAVDPRRERILTWPVCHGWLIVHGDGSSVCRGGQPECEGHLTCDHYNSAACYLADNGCDRGCTPDGHPGCAGTSPRPARPLPGSKP